jgi:sugar phosphate isomerase/epimerase
MSANYVAQQVGYHMTEGWGQGDRATQAHFRPLETFAPRFEEVLRDVRALGFYAIDLWLGHLHPDWATPEHITIARDLLARYELPVISLAGGFGETPGAFERTCKLATALGTRVLGGGTGLLQKDHAALVRLLEQYDLLLAVENHPEKTPADLIARMGDTARGRIGAAVDTGWFGTQGYPVPRALAELAPYLIHVHLKDVDEVGAHRTVGLGAGVVDIEGCVRALQGIGYDGGISIEHEPDDRDPGPECRDSLILLEGWLAEL